MDVKKRAGKHTKRIYKLTGEYNVKFLNEVLCDIMMIVFVSFVYAISKYDSTNITESSYYNMLTISIIAAFVLMLIELWHGHVTKTPFHFVIYLFTMIMSCGVFCKYQYVLILKYGSVYDFTIKALVIPVVVITIFNIISSKIFTYTHDCIFELHNEVDKERKNFDDYVNLYSKFNRKNAEYYVDTGESHGQNYDIIANFDELKISSSDGVVVDGINIHDEELASERGRYSVLIKKNESQKLSKITSKRINELKKEIKNTDLKEYTEYKIAIENTLIRIIKDNFDIKEYVLSDIVPSTYGYVYVIYRHKTGNKYDRKLVFKTSTSGSASRKAEPINLEKTQIRAEANCFDAIEVTDIDVDIIDNKGK